MITGKQLEGYDRDGVVFPIKVLTTEEVTFFREAIEGLVQNRGERLLKRVDGLHLGVLVTVAPLAGVREVVERRRPLAAGGRNVLHRERLQGYGLR